MFLLLLVFLESTGILYAGYWFYKKYLLEKEELDRQYRELDNNMTQLKSLAISYTDVLKQEERYTRNQISSKTKEVKQSLNEAFNRNAREISEVVEDFRETINKMLQNEFSYSKDELLMLKNDILTQESKIVEIVKYTNELNSTSESVFELLKLLLITSVVDKTSALANEINPEVARLEQKKKYTIRFVVNIERNWLKSNYSIGILGDLPELGGWNGDKILQMHKQEHNRYVLQLSISTAKPLVQFKYVLINSNNSKELVWEGGNNRELNLSIEDNGGIIERESIFKSKNDFLKKDADRTHI